MKTIDTKWSPEQQIVTIKVSEEKSLNLKRWVHSLKQMTLKGLIMIITILNVFTLSCEVNNKNPSVVGRWTVENLNASDSSFNKNTLLSTFIVANFQADNLLYFSADRNVTLKTREGKDIGSGTYSIKDKVLVISFPEDNIKSEYNIIEWTDKTIKMTAYHDRETVNMLISRKEL